MRKKSAISEVRLKNLLHLFDEYKKTHGLKDRGANTAFAKAIGTTPNHLNTVKNGTTNIGNAFAQKIEQHLGLEPGYMDTLHSDAEPKNPQEEGFIETALLLFRLSPEAAQDAMIQALTDRLKGKKEK